MIDNVIKGRGEGKTTEAIIRASETNSYVVCTDAEEAKRVATMASDMGFKIPYPMTFDEFLMGRFYSPGVRGFVIDNADLLFDLMVRKCAEGRPVNAATWTPFWE